MTMTAPIASALAVTATSTVPVTPIAGIKRNPAASVPIAAPPVFAAYNRPANCPARAGAWTNQRGKTQRETNDRKQGATRSIAVRPRKDRRQRSQLERHGDRCQHDEDFKECVSDECGVRRQSRGDASA